MSSNIYNTIPSSPLQFTTTRTAASIAVEPIIQDDDTRNARWLPYMRDNNTDDTPVSSFGGNQANNNNMNDNSIRMRFIVGGKPKQHSAMHGIRVPHSSSRKNSAAMISLLCVFLVTCQVSTTMAWIIPFARQGRVTSYFPLEASATVTMDSMSTTTTAATTTKSKNNLRLQSDTTHMFVPPTTLLSMKQQLAGTAAATSTSSSSYRWKQALKDTNNHIPATPTNRGTLGFVLDDNQHCSSTTVASKTVLYATSHSKVDSTSWNGGTTWDLEQQQNDNHNNMDETKNNNKKNKKVPTTTRSQQQRHRLLWSNFSPTYNVMDRIKREHETDLNIEEWQKELLQQPLPKDDEDLLYHGDTRQLSSDTNKKPSVNSLAEWVRTVDLEPLLQRREEIHYQKRHGKQRSKKSPEKESSSSPPPSRQEQIRSLTRLLQGKTTTYSNYQVKQMYAAAKLADQQGQRAVAVEILQQLLVATPQDFRLYRRLARLHQEQGQFAEARAIVQQGLRLDPHNAYLWHGQGNICRLAGQGSAAKQAYRRAMRCNPHVPHSYHALGTLEHSEGHIAAAMQTLKQGIDYCPENHRLHMALGDLYREAKMLDMAEKSYQRALQVGPPVSQGFVYTALAYTAYERDQVDVARQWLRKATRLNRGRQVNAWKSLVGLEESEGNHAEARRLCQVALNQYEGELLLAQRKKNKNAAAKNEPGDGSVLSENETDASTAVSVKNALLQNVPVYRSGDRFFQLYRTWARLEKRYGTVESAEAVYERATAAFPHNTALILDWADMYVRLGLYNQARQVLSMACGTAATSEPNVITRPNSAPVYRRFAELEMSVGDFDTARKILFRGALRLSSSAGGEQEGGTQELAQLYHTWGVCEWHLGDLDRAEILLDHALRLTPAGAEGSELRSTFLYTLARLQYYRGEYLLAQHCVALCLKETNVVGIGNAAVATATTVQAWDLWAAVAAAMENATLEGQCREQAARARSSLASPSSVAEQVVSSLSSLRSEKKKKQGTSVTSAAGLQDQMRLDPWHYKIFPSSTSAAAKQEDDSSLSSSGYRPFAYGVQLPRLENEVAEGSPL